MTPVTLSSDQLDVVVLPEFGARVHSITAFGHALTRTPPTPEAHRRDPFFYGGYHMLPWCNRIEPGPYEVLDRTLTVPANFPDGTAIHGLHAATPWETVGDGTFRCVGGEAGSGWPWTYTATVSFSVDGPTLTIAYALTNTSTAPMPAGIGFHPWFRVPSTVVVPSGSVFADNTLAAPPLPGPVAPPLDLQQPAPLADGVDASWVDLTEPVVRVAWPDLGIGLAMRADDLRVVAVAAKPPDIDDAIAVELQTHAAAGIRRLVNHEPYALHALAPGATLPLELTLTFTEE